MKTFHIFGMQKLTKMTKLLTASPDKVFNQAKSMAYRTVHIPKNLRGKVEIRISAERVTIVRKK
jgi:hypothetical protein